MELVYNMSGFSAAVNESMARRFAGFLAKYQAWRRIRRHGGETRRRYL